MDANHSRSNINSGGTDRRTALRQSRLLTTKTHSAVCQQFKMGVPLWRPRSASPDRQRKKVRLDPREDRDRADRADRPDRPYYTSTSLRRHNALYRPRRAVSGTDQRQWDVDGDDGDGGDGDDWYRMYRTRSLDHRDWGEEWMFPESDTERQTRSGRPYRIDHRFVGLGDRFGGTFRLLREDRNDDRPVGLDGPQGLDEPEEPEDPEVPEGRADYPERPERQERGRIEGPVGPVVPIVPGPLGLQGLEEREGEERNEQVGSVAPARRLRHVHSQRSLGDIGREHRRLRHIPSQRSIVLSDINDPRPHVHFTNPLATSSVNDDSSDDCIT